MVIIKRDKCFDPYFNIAAEEFVLKHLKEDCFSLWRNSKAVIVGKHQNTLAEIDQDFVRANNIAVVRRLSGGGAVFHDLGNICFTFVRSVEGGNMPNFSVFVEPIVEILRQLGAPNCRFEGRNDISIDGKKISGNANAKWQNRILHHGTLLFESSLSNVSSSLKPNPLKFKGKAVESVRSRVGNIKDYIDINIEDFIQKIENYIKELNPNSTLRELTQDENAFIEKLAKEKYQTWEWNYGSSPKYSFSNAIRTQKAGFIELHAEIEGGIIKDIKFFGDYFFAKETTELENTLKGLKADTSQIKKALENIDIQDYFSGIEREELWTILSF